MSKIYFIEGPVGAGKSTYANAIAESGGFTHIALDEWFALLFSPDRPQNDFVSWYIERKDRLINLILGYAYDILATNKDIALEVGMIQREARIAILRQVQNREIDFTIHVLDAPYDIRLERVRRRNIKQGKTFSMVVPDHVFEMASAMWEPPDDFELDEFEFVFPEIY